jgi:hypothetical protein
MSRYGVPNWPPVWTWVDGLENKSPTDKVGILKWLGLTGIEPLTDVIYILITKHHRIWGVCYFMIAPSAATKILGRLGASSRRQS